MGRTLEMPSEETLFCLSPPWIQEYGVLPVELDGGSLHVVAKRKVTPNELEILSQDSKKNIIINEVVDEAIFREAYYRFYGSIFPREMLEKYEP